MKYPGWLRQEWKKAGFVISLLITGLLFLKWADPFTEEIYDVAKMRIDSKDSFEDYLPGFLRDFLFPPSSAIIKADLSISWERCFLPGTAREELKSMLQGQALPEEAEWNFSGMSYAGCFVFLRDKQWYLLFLFEQRDPPVPGKHFFSACRAERQRNGTFVYHGKKGHRFESPELYLKLKNFLKRYDSELNGGTDGDEVVPGNDTND